jgi:exopolysaccharide biosynthesis polyprenyl glycosylphosphotransferase
MPKSIERILLVISDFIAIHATFFCWVLLRSRLGYAVQLTLQDLLVVSFILYLYWILLFFFFGLYRSWYAQSRFDEFVALLKAISLGVVIIFLLTMDLRQDIENPFPLSRLMIFSYWLMMVLFTGAGRMYLRTVQRKFLERGIGLRNAIIVGDGPKAVDLFEQVKRYPALGYRALGVVTFGESDPAGKPDVRSAGTTVPRLGSASELDQLIRKYDVQEVLIALEEDKRQRVIDIIGMCNGLDVNLKIAPDLYDIVVGQVRTNQIYGFPLIEIFPEIMPLWERRVKRLIDIIVSLIVIIGFFPIWVLVAVAIKLDSPGPVFYTQERVGRHGTIFKIIKFRSMYQDAEARTGPVWAGKKDPRVTRVGRILRKLRIDEFPQFINVLKGEMSLVGPRPERPYFVEKLKKEIPYYSRRLRVRPGITGWAQIKHEYDQSLDDVRKKVQYDLYYIENMSLRMDLKIILSTIYTVLTGKGQ